MNAVLSFARYYLKAGLSVIPLRPRDKVATVPWTEYQRRLPMQGELAHWWADGSESNIGVVCGPVSGNLVVLDFDNQLNLRNFLDASPNLEGETVLVGTARGGHIWLQTLEPVRTFRVEEFGLDVKAEGSYVVAPPSIHPSGKSYEFANDVTQILTIPDFGGWLQERLAYLGITWNPNGQRATQPWREVVTQRASEGSRNVNLTSLAGRLRKALPLEDGLAVLQAVNATHCVPPLPETEVGEVAASVWGRYGGPAAPMPLQFTPLADFLGQEEQEPPCIIEGLVPTGAVVLLAGKPKLGKSLLGLNAGLSVSVGARWLGEFSTSPGPVLICALEDRPSLVRKRLRAMAGALGSGEVYVRCGGLHLDRPEAVEALSNEVTKLKPVLVVIDPLIELHHGDENDARAMADAISPLRDLARRHECAFLIVHHRRKSPGPVGDTVRGSSAIFGAVDGIIVVRELSEADPSLEPAPLARLLEAQLRDGPPPDPFQISLDPQTLCF
ncbi:MAG: AAA family ATPase, partial [Chloroflexota bacterium]|nr:AAA family ATPase [Chloroflexota bacterium]